MVSLRFLVVPAPNSAGSSCQTTPIAQHRQIPCIRPIPRKLVRSTSLQIPGSDLSVYARNPVALFRSADQSPFQFKVDPSEVEEPASALAVALALALVLSLVFVFVFVLAFSPKQINLSS
jgi:hypothetical protein